MPWSGQDLCFDLPSLRDPGGTNNLNQIISGPWFSYCHVNSIAIPTLYQPLKQYTVNLIGIWLQKLKKSKKNGVTAFVSSRTPTYCTVDFPSLVSHQHSKCWIWRNYSLWCSRKSGQPDKRQKSHSRQISSLMQCPDLCASYRMRWSE